jgi:DNA adenine methylase
LDPWHRAARMLYLNRNGFNGLYRLNQRGQFNVPYGSYKRPIHLDVENLVGVSKLLRDVEIVTEDFENVLADAKAGDVVYCDPPYWPLSATSSFNAYEGSFFGPEDQARLATSIKALAERFAYGVLSNSDTPETRKLYRGRRTRIRTVFAPRPINRNADGRQRISEILVTVGSRRVAR